MARRSLQEASPKRAQLSAAAKDSEDAHVSNGISLRRTPTQDRSERLMRRIVDSAAELIGADGPDSVTTTRIADHAGVSIGSIYRYFGDREAVFEAVLGRNLDELLTRLREADAFNLSSDDWRARVKDAIDINVAFLRERSTGYLALTYSSGFSGRTNEVNRQGDIDFSKEVVAALPKQRLRRLGRHPVTVVHLAISLGTKGIELAFAGDDMAGDPAMIEETKRAIIAYLECFLN